MTTTSQAHSALILLSVIATALERGESYRLVPEDLPWIMVALELMPAMPLVEVGAGE
jgi:hypothetical protein